MLGYLLWAAVGVIVGDFINLNFYYHLVSPSRGYLLRSVPRVSFYHLVAIAARALLAWLVFLSSAGWFLGSASSGGPIAAAFGLVLVLLFGSADRLVSGKASEGTFKSEFFRSTVRVAERLGIFVSIKYGLRIQQLRAQDNYDCQQGQGVWRFNGCSLPVSRRLRMLYERYKLDIAASKRKPALAVHRPGVSPFQNFYLLVAHLGRRGLLKNLRSDPPSPPPQYSWKGHELRREKNGTKASREPPDNYPQYSRAYDDPELIQAISEGRLN